MRTRLPMVLALLVVWSAVAVFVATKGDKAAQFRAIDQFQQALADADEQWLREALFVGYSADRRTTMPLLSDQFERPMPPVEGRIRVLVLGDSVTFGWGLTDLDVRWTELLEDELWARTAPGAFEVVTLASGGSSTYTYASWMRALTTGEVPPGLSEQDAEAFTRLRGPFDVLVVGHVENDVIPESGDAIFDQPSYVPIDQRELTNRYNRGEDDPNIDAYREAVRSIAASAPGTVLVWQPLAFVPRDMDITDEVADVFAAAGFRTGDAEAFYDLYDAFKGRQFTVSPVDSHPGPAFMFKFAEIAAGNILAALPSDRIATARRAAAGWQATARPIVSNAVPADLEVVEASASVTIHLPPIAERDRPCTSTTTGAQTATQCVPSDQPGVGDRLVYLVNGREVPPQYVPCAPLGRPYAQVMFDPHKAGTLVELTHTAGPPLDVFFYGYDARGSEQITPWGVLEPGVPLRTTLVNRSFRGVLVAAADSSGCDAPELPAFTITATTY